MWTRLAVDRDLARVGGLHAGDRLDQRRLAGAVVADEGDDLAGIELEVGVDERLDLAEALGHALRDEQGLPLGGGDSGAGVSGTPTTSMSVGMGVVLVSMTVLLG